MTIAQIYNQLNEFENYYNVIGTSSLEEADYIFLAECHDDKEMKLMSSKYHL